MNIRKNFCCLIFALLALVIVPSDAKKPTKKKYDEILENQETILENQEAILNNQETLLNNQETLLAMDAKLDAIQANQMVPFIETLTFPVNNTEVGLCSLAGGPGFPVILIEGSNPNGDDTKFVVDSVIVQKASQDIEEPETGGFDRFVLLDISVDGVYFLARTGNLFQSDLASAVAADLLGTPVRMTHLIGDDPPDGGNIPHRIVASVAPSTTSPGFSTIDSFGITLYLWCESADYDVGISKILVSGWKARTDTISVIYDNGALGILS